MECGSLGRRVVAVAHATARLYVSLFTRKALGVLVISGKYGIVLKR
jgi:hypothetical protein